MNRQLAELLVRIAEGLAYKIKSTKEMIASKDACPSTETMIGAWEGREDYRVFLLEQQVRDAADLKTIAKAIFEASAASREPLLSEETALTMAAIAVGMKL